MCVEKSMEITFYKGGFGKKKWYLLMVSQEYVKKKLGTSKAVQWII